jgi:uroporphyrinogen-III synthase
VRPPRILVTRSPHQASALADHLRAFGAEPILIPTIEIVAPTSFAVLEAVVDRLDNFDWLVFTSANAVAGFYRWLHAFKGWGNSEHEPQAVMSAEERRKTFGENGTRIAAIGQGTAAALEAIGLPPDLIPSQAVAESLAEALLPFVRQPDGSPSSFLLIRAEEARDHIPRTLRTAGAEVVIAPVYRAVIPAGSVDAIRELFSRPENYPDAITFTSASTARNLFALFGAAGLTLPADIVRASIGPITSATLRDLGYPPQVEASEARVALLVENLVNHFDFKKTS